MSETFVGEFTEPPEVSNNEIPSRDIGIGPVMIL